MPDNGDLFSKALGLAEQEKYAEAPDLLNQTIRNDANNANARYSRGVSLFRMCDYRGALNAFGQASDPDPEFAEACYHKGIAHAHPKKHHEAIRALEKVLKIHPRDRQAWYQRDLVQKKIMESLRFSSPSSEDQTKLFK
jgi:tetratricopeptide (TPR) repeat protein